jgi:hypothetical protein
MFALVKLFSIDTILQEPSVYDIKKDGCFTILCIQTCRLCAFENCNFPLKWVA